MWLKSFGIKWCRIKPDCLLVKENQENLKRRVTVNNKIGNVKFESCKDTIIKIVTLPINNYKQFKPIQVNIININDECNFSEIRARINMYDNVVIEASLPG